MIYTSLNIMVTRLDYRYGLPNRTTRIICGINQRNLDVSNLEVSRMTRFFIAKSLM